MLIAGVPHRSCSLARRRCSMRFARHSGSVGARRSLGSRDVVTVSRSIVEDDFLPGVSVGLRITIYAHFQRGGSEPPRSRLTCEGLPGALRRRARSAEWRLTGQR